MGTMKRTVYRVAEEGEDVDVDARERRGNTCSR